MRWSKFTLEIAKGQFNSGFLGIHAWVSRHVRPGEPDVKYKEMHACILHDSLAIKSLSWYSRYLNNQSVNTNLSLQIEGGHPKQSVGVHRNMTEATTAMLQC